MSRGHASIRCPRRLGTCSAVAAAALLLFTLTSLAEVAPPIPPETPACRELAIARGRADDSWYNWSEGDLAAGRRYWAVDAQFQKAKQDTDRLNCWPRREDKASTCTAALARHDSLLEELRATKTNYEAVHKAAVAATERAIRAYNTWRDACWPGGPSARPLEALLPPYRPPNVLPGEEKPPTITPEDLPLFPPAPSTEQPTPPTTPAADPCKGFEDWRSRVSNTASALATETATARSMRDQIQERFHEVNQETERLNCWPRREDNTPACKAALARHDAVLAELRQAEAELDAKSQAHEAQIRRLDQVDLLFRRCREIAGAGPKPADLPLFPPLAPTEPPATKPPPPPPPVTEQPKPPAPPAPPPATETFVPRVLSPGTYQAQLWPGTPLLSWCRGNIIFPHPVILTVDASGKVTGTSRYKLAPAEIKATEPVCAHAANDVSFRLDGKIDWTTGAITLRLLDGRRDEGYYDSHGPYLSHMEFEFSLSGWQLGHPALRKRAALYLAPNPPADMEARGLPQFAVDAARQVTFRDFGFAGMPDHDVATGGGSRFTVQKFIGGDKKDRTDVIKAGWEGGVTPWYLKILGPMTVTPEAKPPTGAQKDPNGFAVWPLSPLRVKPGDTFTLNAMGAYADNPYDAVNLNDRSTWEMSPGVARSGGNQFRAAAPGRYQVTATFRRSDGGTMSGTVEIIVGP